MIISVAELRQLTDCGTMTDEAIKTQLAAIEEVVRRYTNNNFQNRNIRFDAESDGRYTLLAALPYIEPGDTVQISQSKVNDGLYTVAAVTENETVLEEKIFGVLYNLVTKVEYPAHVKQCAVDLFEWKRDFGHKAGIKSESETLSRHSETVTYEDSSTMFMGFPKGILTALNGDRKLRC